MNKKILLSLFLFCCMAPSILMGALWTTSGKIAYFSPTSSHLRKVYGDAFINYEIEVTRSIFCNWEIWADLDFYTASGHFPHSHQSSRLQVLPLSLGLSYNWKVCRNLYWNIGAGAAYTYARFKPYEEHEKNLTKWGFGGVFKTSLKYYWCNGIFAELFLDYFYQHFNRHRYVDTSDSLESGILNPFHVHHKRKPALNVGGTKIGIGVGYLF